MKNIWKWIAAVVIGGAGGFLYWYYIGCTNGCAITSSPVNSTLYGAVLAALLLNSVGGGSSKKDPDKDE